MLKGNVSYVSVIILFFFQYAQKYKLSFSSACYSNIFKQHTKIKSSRYTILHRTVLQTSQSIHKIPDIIKSNVHLYNQPSKEYLIEFRGLNPSFRYDEFIDAYYTILQSNHNKLIYDDNYQSSMKLSSKQLFDNNVIFIEAIPDTLSEYPICAYVLLPSDQIAIEITKRCSMVRRVIEVWGDKPSIQETSYETIERFDSIIEPVLKQKQQYLDLPVTIVTPSIIDNIDLPYEASISKDITIKPVNTWWVHFERYGKGGKSGLSVDEKRNLLLQFKPLFKLINSTVDYINPDHNLIYFEDWSSYQTGFNALLALARMNSNGTTLSNLDIHYIKTNYTLNYQPHSCVFGRIICTGPSIVGLFDLKLRPFIGTTSMNALCAHIAANAANVQVGQQVLDPFCGTGSLLLAAAYLGAYVVGSDIDLDSLGKTMNTTSNSNSNINSNNSKCISSNSNSIINSNNSKCISSNSINFSNTTSDINTVSNMKSRSKNIRFLRKDGQNQVNRNTLDNFNFYNLTDKVLDFIGVDAIQWLPYNSSNSYDEDNLCSDNTIAKEELKLMNKYDKFDAIISDPPFGRREKAIQSELHYHQQRHTNQSKTQDITAPITSPIHNSLHNSLDITSNLGHNLRMQLSNEIMLDIDQSSMGDPLLMIEVLLRIANHRLKDNGKLVFFLPTKAFVSIDQVMILLNLVINDAMQLSYLNNNLTNSSQTNYNNNNNDKSSQTITRLLIERVIPEELSNSLWRWLCVVKLVHQVNNM